MPDRIKTAEHHRKRAKELRSISKGLFDKDERKILVEAAKEFEQMAAEAKAK